MRLQLVANGSVGTLFESTDEFPVQTIIIQLGSTMVELSTPHQANSSTSLDIVLQQQQDIPGAPLPSSTSSLPRDITPPPPKKASATGTTTSIIELTVAEQRHTKEQRRINMRNLLLMVATVFATMTYQAGLAPPGGFWQDDQPPYNGTCIINMTTPNHINTTMVGITTSSNVATPSNGNNHTAGHAILGDMNHTRYILFFWTNSIAFIYSMGTIVLLLSETVSLKLDRLDQYSLESVMAINALIIVVAYSIGCGRNYFTFTIPVSAMVAFLFVSAVLGIIRKKDILDMFLGCFEFVKYCALIICSRAVEE